MPTTLTGNPAAVTARQAATASSPVDGEGATAASVDTPLQSLLDLCAFVMQNAALLGGVANAGELSVYGGAGDTSAAVSTPTTPTNRKLLLNLQSSATVRTRVYVEKWTGGGPSVAGGLTLTVNAYWNGSAWAPDDATKDMNALRLGLSGLQWATYGPLMLPAPPLTDSQFFTNIAGLPTAAASNFGKQGTVLGVSNAGTTTLWGPGTGYYISEALHVVGAGGGAPAFGTSWNTPATGNTRLAYWMDAFGVVHLEGMAVTTDTSNPAFTLPSGYRPLGAVSFGSVYYDSVATQYKPCIIDILANGNVQVHQASLAAGFTFGGIAFRADATVMP